MANSRDLKGVQIDHSLNDLQEGNTDTFITSIG